VTVALATAADIPFSDQDEAALQAALAERGIPTELAVWNDPAVDWRAYDLVVVRSTWDYTLDRDGFVDWAMRVEQVTRLCNPAAVIRWNTHKGYLIELEERGVPIVPTAWLGRGDRVDLAALVASRRWREVVVKPAVGAGAEGLHVVTGDPATGQEHLDALLARGDAMVQPYLGRLAEDGELSVVVIDGTVSHAIRKLPAAGDPRVQIEFGGRYEPDPLDDDRIALAEWIVEVAGHDLLYARVDLLPADDGTWQLSELEATEPSLYLDRIEGAADRMAAAVARRL
jgi:glutathione synthase/RimK-type ligase-like ATP-grasp enzyme